MATTPHPAPVPHKEVATPKVEPATVVTPREGTEPGEGLVPHHGGGFAKTGGAYSGGCVQPEAPPPPEGDATKKK